jgi:MOSC domain-containing protein YiiM
VPGARVRAGAVELEISKRCDPCVVLYGLPYVGQERGPGFMRTLRGRRGWFARVVRGGVVRVGMEIGP